MKQPSFARYRQLFVGGSDHSVLRTLQYEQLAEWPDMGRVLDFGGGDAADYRRLVRCSVYESINIAPSMKPTWLTAVGERLPCERGRYDTVLSMNTFEHVFDVRPLLAELRQALKPGGSFLAMVPFLFPVHAHPDDYFRPTPSWWNAALPEAGFGDVDVAPLFWGRRATGLTCSGMSGPLQRPRLHLALLLDLLAFKIKPPPHALAINRAIGYVVTARPRAVR